MHTGTNNHKSNSDILLTCHNHPCLRIPSGNYQAQYIRYETQFMFGRKKMFLWFQIIESGEFSGAELYMPCDTPKKGRWPVSSKFCQAWSIANGRNPKRKDRISLRVFQNKVFLVQVRIVKKNAKNTERPIETQYSVVDQILKCVYDPMGISLNSHEP